MLEAAGTSPAHLEDQVEAIVSRVEQTSIIPPGWFSTYVRCSPGSENERYIAHVASWDCPGTAVQNIIHYDHINSGNISLLFI